MTRIFAFAVISLLAVSAAAERGKKKSDKSEPSRARETEMTKTARGALLKVPAGDGVGDDLLGKGFDKDLVETAETAYPNTPDAIRKRPASEVRQQLVILENEQQLKANARLLFASAGISTSENKRYAVLTQYGASSISELATVGPPAQKETAFVAFRVYYGWSANVIISGDESTFTAEVAARLGKVGADVFAIASESKLEVRTQTFGLQTKSGGPAVIASLKDVEDKYVGSKEPAPIFVEYKAVRDSETPVIRVEPPRYAAGTYRIASFTIQMSAAKAGGNPWDAAGLPDPFIRIFVEANLVANCQGQDVTGAFTCTPNTVITVRKWSSITVDVLEKDLMANDPVGRLTLANVTSTPIADELPFNCDATQGQVSSASISLIAVP